MGDDYFKPGNYRRINARLKYAKGQEISKTREYYHMPPLLSGPPVKLNNNVQFLLPRKSIGRKNSELQK